MNNNITPRARSGPSARADIGAAEAPGSYREIQVTLQRVALRIWKHDPMVRNVWPVAHPALDGNLVRPK